MRFYDRFVAVILVLFAVMFVSCSKPEPEEFVVQARIDSPLSVRPGDEVTCTVYSSKGPGVTDSVVLTNYKTEAETVCPIIAADAEKFVFVIPEGLESGTFSFGVRRGDRTLILGAVEIIVTKDDPGNPVKPAEGSSVYGLVSCGGQPLSGVVVTDGYLVTVTGSDGVYQLASEKKNGMVYISTPSGYTAPCVGVQAKFYKYTRYGRGTVERVDFELEETGDQTNHTMFFFGDMHLANRTNKDLAQFREFTDEISEYMKAHPSEKIYATTLGDMTWDLYWYSNNFQFQNYLEQINRILNLTVYHTMGNHDHNMQTSIKGASEGWEAVDWDTEKQYRSAMGPNYYSFNIGKIHYIVLDDIFCKNTTGGTSSDRKYSEELIPADLNWLKEDLKYVDKSTPLYITMHANIYDYEGHKNLVNTAALTSAVEGFSSVTFITGHTHVLFTLDTDKFREINSGALCATWWWAGSFDARLNVGLDGALGGYRIMDVKGKETSSYFKCTGRDENYQFRTYDRNCIKIVPSDYGVKTAKNVESFNTALSLYGGYGTSSSSNYVFVNVWDYGPGWNIEVTEKGSKLAVTRVDTYDPLFIISYSAPMYRNTDQPTWVPARTGHMFRVTASSATSTLEIKVTDDEGREYRETMTRPKAFNAAAYK